MVMRLSISVLDHVRGAAIGEIDEHVGVPGEQIVVEQQPYADLGPTIVTDVAIPAGGAVVPSRGKPASGALLVAVGAP
jgi:hypothetical protein